MTQVIGNLYVGGSNNVNFQFLDERKIKTVINVARECIYECDTFTECKFYYFAIDDDFCDITSYFDIILPIIRERLGIGPVLVHCKAGVSRSASFILAYLIREYCMTLNDAYVYLHERRSIMPNPHFMKQLMDFEKKCMGSESFKDQFDDYVIRFIMISMNIDKSLRDDVKITYIANGRDFFKTVKSVADLVIIVQTSGDAVSYVF